MHVFIRFPLYFEIFFSQHSFETLLTFHVTNNNIPCLQNSCVEHLSYTQFTVTRAYGWMRKPISVVVAVLSVLLIVLENWFELLAHKLYGKVCIWREKNVRDFFYDGMEDSGGRAKMEHTKKHNGKGIKMYTYLCMQLWHR